MMLLNSCQTIVSETPNPSGSSDALDKLTNSIANQSSYKSHTPNGLIDGVEFNNSSGQVSSQSEATTTITSFDEMDSLDSELAWGDDEGSGEVNEITKNTSQNNNWHTSFAQALEEARLRQKPLFIWFTNSAEYLSPNSLTLYDELIKTEDFNNWVLDNFVAFTIDKNIIEPDKQLRYEKQRHLKKLLQNLNIRVAPTILVYTPDSNLIDRHVYSDISSDYLWKELKRNLKSAEKSIKINQKQALRNGYRLWEVNGLNYQPLAQLIQYQPGILKLRTPYNNEFTVKTTALSDNDYNWLQLQIAKSKR